MQCCHFTDCLSPSSELRVTGGGRGGQCSKGAGDWSPVQLRLWHQSTIQGKAKSLGEEAAQKRFKEKFLERDINNVW